MSSKTHVVPKAVNFISAAAAIAQAWDLVIYFTDEVEFLWKGNFNAVKALYWAARYGLLLAQIMNQFLTFHLDYEHSFSRSSNVCSAIFIYKVVFSQVALSITEITLLIRVYALYNKGFKARTFLLFIFLVSVALEGIGNRYLIKALLNVKECFYPNSDRKGLMLIGIGAGITQCTVFLMTLAKFLRKGRDGWTRTPLTNLMLKEGTLAFLLIIVLIVVLVVYELVRDRILGTERATQSWYAALLSIAASRLILNMRKLAMTYRMQRNNNVTREGNSRDRSSSNMSQERVDSIILTTMDSWTL